MAASNELAVSMEEMASAAEQIKTNAEVETAVESAAIEVPKSIEDSPIQVESDFWSNNDVDNEISNDLSVSEEETSPALAGVETFLYKANGEDVEISLDEAKKKLALYDGSRKAFQDRAKLKKQVAQFEKQNAELQEYKQTWDKLEGLKDNLPRLFEAITGKPYNEFISGELERKQVYASASPAEQRAMDYEERMKAIEQELNTSRESHQREKEQVESARNEAERTYLKSQMEREFFKYQLPETSDPAIANKLKEMLWTNTVMDLKKYAKKGYKPKPSVIKKAFQDNAKALQHFKSEEVAKGVDAALEQKRTQAKEKAQLASTRNYKPTVSSDLTKLDPVALFNRIRGRK